METLCESLPAWLPHVSFGCVVRFVDWCIRARAKAASVFLSYSMRGFPVLLLTRWQAGSLPLNPRSNQRG